MDQKSQEHLKVLLGSTVPEVISFINDMDLSSARMAMLPLIKGLRDIGPRQVKGSASVETFGHRLMRLINAGLTLAEERRAEGKSIRQRECYSLSAAFERITTEALAFVTSTPITTEEDRRSRVNADPLSDDPTSNTPMQNLRQDMLKFQLTKYDASKDALRREIIRHGYTFQRAPVVALCRPFLILNEVQKYFNVDSFGSYPILKQQFVMGASDAYILKWTSKVPMVERKAAIRMGKSAPSRVRVVFDVLLEALNDRYPGKKYIVVGTPYRWDNSYWVWLMTSHDYDLLRRCSSTPGSLTVNSWGLALSTGEEEFVARSGVKA